MRQSTVLQLPLPIHAQLKALAKKRDKTMVQIIADVIEAAIEAGELPDETPGFLIEVVEGSVVLHALHTPTCGDRLAVMDAETAEGLAETLENITNSRLVGHLTESGFLGVRRKGTGISLEPDVNDPSKSYVVAPTVALSLARQIRKAALQAIRK